MDIFQNPDFDLIVKTADKMGLKAIVVRQQTDGALPVVHLATDYERLKRDIVLLHSAMEK